MYIPRKPDDLKHDLIVIDALIRELIRKRIELIEEVGLGKALIQRETGEIDPIFNPKREQARLDGAKEWAISHGINPAFASSLFYDIMNESCKIQMEHTQDGTYEKLLDQLGDEEHWYGYLRDNLLKLTAQEAAGYEENYSQASYPMRDFLEYEYERMFLTTTWLARDTALALDLGCATGRTTRMLSTVFDQVIGADLSQHMVARARQLVDNESLKNVTILDALDLESEEGWDGWVAPGSASFINLNLGTGSDFVNMDLMMSRAARALRKGGRIHASFYNKDGLLYLWKILPWQSGLRASINIHKDCLDVMSKNDAGLEGALSIHARAYTVDEVKALFAGCGLNVITDRTYPTISSVLPAELFDKQPEKTDLIGAADRKLEEAGLGAYIIISALKPYV